MRETLCSTPGIKLTNTPDVLDLFVCEYLLTTSFLLERNFKQVNGTDVTYLYNNKQKCPIQLCEPKKRASEKYYKYGHYTLQLIEKLIQ